MKAVTKPPPKNKFVLYVGDETSNSRLAIANLTALCRQYLPDRHEIEVVNVFQQPERALTDHVFMTPILIRLAPNPVRRIVGTLSQTENIVGALGLVELPR
jgi:circadian clock protein KaiB